MSESTERYPTRPTDPEHHEVVALLNNQMDLKFRVVYKESEELCHWPMAYFGHGYKSEAERAMQRLVDGMRDVDYYGWVWPEMADDGYGWCVEAYWDIVPEEWGEVCP